LITPAKSFKYSRERAYFDPSARAARENWPVVKIGEIFKTSSGGTPLKSKNEYYEGGAIPWLGSGEVAQGQIEKSKNFITELALKETSVKLFPKDSVLIAMYGALPKFVKIVLSGGQIILDYDAINKIKLDDYINKPFPIEFILAVLFIFISG
jgi:restriction endonuclease S subunit